MSFTPFWRRNRAFFELAIISQLEYRLNFFVDAVAQPLIAAIVEWILWAAIFDLNGLTEVQGLPKEAYLAYAVWGAFWSRLTTNWMYEFRMITEIDRGTINTILTRPFSFYEYYLSQFFGYKSFVLITSFLAPLTVSLYLQLPVQYERMPVAILLSLYYLLFVFSISFTIASSAFFFNKVQGFTAAKNFLLWFLSGELLPLDLAPEPYRTWIVNLPFAAGVFIPVGYITGRFEFDQVVNTILAITVGLLVINLCNIWLWRRGREAYAGTGA